MTHEQDITMDIPTGPILVLGATGQQGGAVARALRAQGWPVRALVRDPDSAKAHTLAAMGIQVVRGDQGDRGSLAAALAGCHGVFSVQPSSGQGAAYGVTDAQEVRYGKTVADLAVDAGVEHLVYSSTVAVGLTPTGMGHFDTKREIEQHIRNLPLRFTIVRPATFMEMLLLPGMGLDQGRFSFFLRPDQSAQVIAAEDIGRIVAGIFAAPDEFAAQTIEIAGDAATGAELAEAFSQQAGRPIAYARFPDTLLAQNPFLGALTKLVDDGRLTGRADLTALRTRFPGLLTLDRWLATTGRPLLDAALQAEAGEVALR